MHSVDMLTVGPCYPPFSLNNMQILLNQVTIAVVKYKLAEVDLILPWKPQEESLFHSFFASFMCAIFF